ncbi:MAG: FAD-binding protein [Fibrobacteria bacterium]|nr:FAD-binding protein [Fibrobacteria bacterium]
MALLPQNFIEQLFDLCGKQSVLFDEIDLAGYENDALGFYRYKPDCVVIPETSEELKNLILLCYKWDITWLVRGAGTSLSGGPVAVNGGIIIHLSKLKSLLEVCENDMYCLVEPGVVLNNLNKALKPLGLFYPPDPSSGFSCTIGGNVAENAGGIRCFKYGVTANYVLGLEVILPTGEVVQFGGPAGGLGNFNYDWRALFTGSEGTLGVISKIWLRLKPLPHKVWTFLAAFEKVDDAIKAVIKLKQNTITPVALELMDNRIVQLVENSGFAVGLDRKCCYLLLEIDGPGGFIESQVTPLESLLLSNGALSVKKTSDEAERLNLWKARKVFGGLLGQISPNIMSQDVVVPSSFIADILDFFYTEADKLGVPAVCVAHAGDGNMHPNLLFNATKPGEIDKIHKLSAMLMKKVVECGGALSGEHGIGCDKKHHMQLAYSPQELLFQKSALWCFNPENNLNPGKIFEDITSENTPIPFFSKTFEPFYDPDNLAIGVSVEEKISDINKRINADGLYFPLNIDDNLSLADQLHLQAYAPSSFKYGSFSDNILGMGFEINGHYIHLGSKTIKNVTGFDFIRFICNSNYPVGLLKNCTLRLRPKCNNILSFEISGDISLLERFRITFMKSSLSGLAEILDFTITPDKSQLYIAFPYSPEQESFVYENLVKMASESGVNPSVISPDSKQKETTVTELIATIKTNLTQTLNTAKKIASEYGIEASGQLGNGFFQLRSNSGFNPSLEFTSSLAILQKTLINDGGNVFTLNSSFSENQQETIWIDSLKKSWKNLDRAKK